jgi:hypothetical protein
MARNSPENRPHKTTFNANAFNTAVVNIPTFGLVAP